MDKREARGGLRAVGVGGRVVMGVVAGTLCLSMMGCGSSGSGSAQTQAAASSAAASSTTPAADTAATTTPAASTSAASTAAEQADASDESTYQGILDEYTAKLQEATPALIDEYNTEAATNTDGVQGLATICQAKVTKLAGISTEGTTKMARLLYTSGSGSTSEYQEWAGKLSDVYTEEAQKITDAYTASVM